MEWTKKPLSLYVHIPFCVRKCAYCDFLSFAAGEKEYEAYEAALRAEIALSAVACSGYEVKTVFFGGGTPTILESHRLTGLLDAIRGSFSVAEDAEITTECNPGTVTAEDLRILRQGGFNRLSIGVQSLREEELRLLGRIHTKQQFLDCYRAAREAGFSNINLDLMEALPGQREESLRATLEEAIALEPEHISAYSLIIEEGTPFFERYERALQEREKNGFDREGLLPDEEAERAMDRLTEELLEKAGYERYEISNYAKPGYACKHNSVYWRRGDYLGLGLGSASLMEGTRFCNTDSLEDYLGGNFKDPSSEQILTTGDAMAEFLFLGLRMTEGVSAKDFENAFSVSMDSVYGSIIKRQTEEGMLLRRQQFGGDYRISFTAKGRDVSNILLAEYLL